MTEHVAFQVQLTRAQHRRLRDLARSRGASMGSLVRESVAAYIAGQPIEDDPAFDIIGLIEDTAPQPHGSVAEHHDLYIADAIEAEVRPASQDHSTATRPR